MKSRRTFLAIIIPAILLVWIWISRVPTSSLPSSSIEAPKDTFLAPSFELQSTSGQYISLHDLLGRPIILNFWASWCPPCRSEMPAFQQTWEEYHQAGLEIIAINATHQDSLPEIEDFIAQNQLEFSILLDPNGSASTTYQIHSLPTTFFINREGIILKTIIGGPIPLPQLRIQADQLLQDSPNASDN